jgi:alanyl-tRNA synthetase
MTTLREPAYHRDPRCIELDTEVVAASGDESQAWVELEDTIFYPEGGGQPADHGTIEGVEVVDVQKTDQRIRHYLSEPVAEGPAHLVLDWSRRWDHMQQHTAQHVLTAVALRDFGWRTTAFHLGPETSDIELDVPRLERADLDRLEDAVEAEITAARPVSSMSAEIDDFERLGVRSRRLPDGFTGSVRLVNIEGLDLNTCGGTHLETTAEIGALCLLGTEPMRGGIRVFFVAGERVRRRMARHEERNAALRALLDTGDDDLAEVVALRLEREKSLARSNRLLSSELAESAAASLATASDPVLERHWPDRDMAFLQQVGRKVAAANPRVRALITAAGDGEVFMVVAGAESGLDLAAAGGAIAELLDGRGGGRGEIFQGKAGSLAKRAEAIELLAKDEWWCSG